MQSTNNNLVTTNTASIENKLKIVMQCVRYTCASDVLLTLYFNVILTNIYYNNRYIDYLGGFLILASILYKTVGTVKLKEFTIGDTFSLNNIKTSQLLTEESIKKSHQKFSQIFRFYSTPYKISIALQYCLVLIACFQYFYNDNILNYISLGVVHASLHIKEVSSVLALYNSLKYIINNNGITHTVTTINELSEPVPTDIENQLNLDNVDNTNIVDLPIINTNESKQEELLENDTSKKHYIPLKKELIDELKYKLNDRINIRKI